MPRAQDDLASHPRRPGRTVLARSLPVLAASALLATLFSGVASASSGSVYVSLGDSYTSGPLIPDQTGNPAGCLRSTSNYPSLTAAALGASSFTDASCQGATTANFTQSQSVPLGTNPPQFNSLTPGTTLVSMGIGGNDIGFLDIVVTCAEDSVSSPLGSPCEKQYTAGGTDQLKAAIDQTAPKIAAAIQRIHQLSPAAKVLVVGYPDILPNSGHGCWPVVPIAYGDVPYLRGVELELNQMLANEAAANGATFVDTYTDSIGHDACQSTGTKWVEGPIPTSDAAPFHPNAPGEGAMARQVEAAAG
ncbi:MAG TPA: SGNH/GDSL hydrolase family protein [Streptosporangiaceae bacterium]